MDVCRDLSRGIHSSMQPILQALGDYVSKATFTRQLTEPVCSPKPRDFSACHETTLYDFRKQPVSSPIGRRVYTWQQVRKHGRDLGTRPKPSPSPFRTTLLLCCPGSPSPSLSTTTSLRSPRSAAHPCRLTSTSGITRRQAPTFA